METIKVLKEWNIRLFIFLSNLELWLRGLLFLELWIFGLLWEWRCLLLLTFWFLTQLVNIQNELFGIRWLLGGEKDGIWILLCLIFLMQRMFVFLDYKSGLQINLKNWMLNVMRLKEKIIDCGFGLLFLVPFFGWFFRVRFMLIWLFKLWIKILLLEILLFICLLRELFLNVFLPC